MNDFYRTPPASAHPAKWLVHTVQGSEPCCEPHAVALKNVMAACSSETHLTPAPIGSQCRNCINEEKRRG